MPDTDSQTSYDRSVNIVRSAIPRMSQLKIPITPSNYAVWYEYLSDSNQALRTEMDALLSRAQPISDSEMHVLYERYLEENSEKVRFAKAALSQAVNALMSHITRADGHYSSFSTELGQVIQGLAGEVSSDSLNTLIDRAVRATSQALERSAELRQRFSVLADEMQQVRGELARSQVEARSDALTGLHNRLAFHEELADLPRVAATDLHAPCLLLADIDFFKRVNDTHGHLAGDQVLRAVAREIRANVRGRDLVARHGGEEFAVLLRDTPRSGCQAVAENVRLHVARRAITLPEEPGVDESLAVTVSLGGAWFRDGDSIESFVDRADRALYLSKHGGRNRVCWEGRRTDN